MGEVILICNKGKILLGRASIFGFLPFVTFESFQELRNFVDGLDAFCEHFRPDVPEVFLKAFEEEDSNENRN